jgi:hypothetical protein
MQVFARRPEQLFTLRSLSGLDVFRNVKAYLENLDGMLAADSRNPKTSGQPGGAAFAQEFPGFESCASRCHPEERSDEGSASSSFSFFLFFFLFFSARGPSFPRAVFIDSGFMERT